ncbi:MULTISPECIES: tripartite tricarboxylate transporter substrate binding protein BugE [Hydrogenophaga]|uniref:TTT family tricarboxylate transporter, receptor protein n=1 Tax=Hydrogenophaga intermedia TaxID=65786 RepID=A0A1L1PEI1_HYDIT|nr:MULTISPECIES: tripartite tricarboxylate transporter substrate binding protein BugE [Hydrogenophaga]AOS80397.1 ABC transporter substrate-binding protein [Hydrogenophaga sp. PBC]TMU78051.1 tripartite tricarboxylate transporter substrate binding protein BugE [Hydrogenophaga intermedia]CDN88482.1 TTT family tricarboxylate transporter, receptor protein [Hydrogenophaga intermedia]
MNMPTLLRAALTLTAALALGSAQAQAPYPNRPIKLVVPFAPGGSTDLAARLVAEYGSRELGQSIVVENKAGAGGSTGMEFVARSAPDGYTLGMATVSTHGSNPAVYGNRLRYDPVKDFAPITNVATTPSVFAVHPSTPANTMKEFIALAQANPGKYSFASPGMGSLGHANIEHFMALAKFQLLHIPYKGAGQAMTDALSGQVTAITDNLPSALTNIQSGKLRALAVLSEKRSPSLPDVPTYGELGFPQMGTGGWFGVVAPAGTPPEVVARLNAALHKAMKIPAFIQKMDESGATLIPGTPQAFAQQIQQAMERYARVAKMAKISLD